MAKAKFPGKPSKTSQITRLRVSSKCATSVSDPSRIIAKETALGLQLFNDNFPAEDEEEDFVGFEKIGDVFEFRYGPRKSKCSKVASSQSVNHRDNGKTLVNDSADGCDKKVGRNWSNLYSSYNGGNESLARKLLEKAKSSPKKFVKKRLRDEAEMMKKTQRHKSRDFHRLPLPSDKGCLGLQEKTRMKREIERYTDIMTTDLVDQKLAAEEKIKHRRSASEKSKEGKLREKIQQLLRSQWESRLQLVDGKVDGNTSFERYPLEK